MKAEQLLRKLGASGKLTGFPYAVYMVERTKKDASAVNLITKCLYPATAKRFGVSASRVERNLRTVVQACWKQPDREALETVAGMRLHRRPTNSEFLDMTAAYLRRQEQN